MPSVYPSSTPISFPNSSLACVMSKVARTHAISSHSCGSSHEDVNFKFGLAQHTVAPATCLPTHTLIGGSKTFVNFPKTIGLTDDQIRTQESYHRRLTGHQAPKSVLDGTQIHQGSSFHRVSLPWPQSRVSELVALDTFTHGLTRYS